MNIHTNARRFRCFRQTELSDCGPTCVRMVAYSLGCRISRVTMRRMVETSKAGVTIGDLCDSCRTLGLNPYPLRIGMDSLGRMPLPAILYWEQRHFVVLYHIGGGKRPYPIADPAIGKVKLTEEEIRKSWCSDSDYGIALIVGISESFTPLYEDDTTFWSLGKFILRELKGYRNSFTIILLLSMLCMAADVVIPLLFQRTVDEGIRDRDIGLIWLLVFGQLGMFAGNMSSSGIAGHLLTRLGMKMDIEMVGRYLKGLISRPMAFFDTHASSGLIQKLNDQSRIRNFLTALPGTILFMVLNLFVFSVMLFLYSRIIFCIFFVMSLLVLGWTCIILPSRRSLDHSTFSEAAENRNIVHELVTGMADIRIAGSQNRSYTRWYNSQKQLNNIRIRSSLLELWNNGGNSVISRLRDLLITGICATMVVQEYMSIGEMMTVNYITGSLNGPFSRFISVISGVQDASLAYERLEEVIEPEDTPIGCKDFSDRGVIFEHVWFRYPGVSSPFILKDFSLRIKHGQMVAVVGESGCGKSTLLRLILGFYIPQRGRILLGGVNVSQIDHDQWLSGCGVVLQSGKIFSDTVLANIAMCDELPDMERVREAIYIAGLESYVSSLPMGLATRIGTTGIDMSGGQSQRLMIARAVYRHPNLLVLDEATSSLDAVNEAAIVRRLREFNRHRTVVVAAHRLSTVQNADLIIHMADGQICEMGTHTELVEAHGAYYELVRNQLQFSL
ncbi:MAG: peptidase domain-containing ABC transporter [Muribaculaceae bacterium]|nr:peptidase domain-containing ABC transporter [Muribaculaceae bacterium]